MTSLEKMQKLEALARGSSAQMLPHEREQAWDQALAKVEGPSVIRKVASTVGLPLSLLLMFNSSMPNLRPVGMGCLWAAVLFVLVVAGFATGAIWEILAWLGGF